MSDAADPLAQIRTHGAVPRHVAIIMDGNGRWARERMLPRPLGHRSGMKAVRAVVEAALEAGVEVLSLFAFSQENWQRPVTEVSALMSLLEEYIAREAAELERRGVRVCFLGELDRLGPGQRNAVDAVMSRTACCDRLRLNLFVSYGSRAEMVLAVRGIAEDAAAGRLAPEEVGEDLISQRMFTAGCPDPDLLIRTSGEQRISNFLLWQLAYTEIFISPVLWPDFGRKELFDAILDYQRRERRFGRVQA
ncbi:MAG: di-trans,poly-cis-decaprenylcistransferase [Gemmatimonadaceae bacterium]|nr:di-trans,poly-cis-decaprenylcistransferase [Gemmatimonadaceae bacterium]